MSTRLRARREVRGARRVRVRGIDDRANRACRERAIASEQMRERDAAEPGGGVREEIAAAEEWMHGVTLENEEKLARVVERAAKDWRPCSRIIAADWLCSKASGGRA